MNACDAALEDLLSIPMGMGMDLDMINYDQTPASPVSEPDSPPSASVPPFSAIPSTPLGPSGMGMGVLEYNMMIAAALRYKRLQQYQQMQLQQQHQVQLMVAAAAAAAQQQQQQFLISQQTAASAQAPAGDALAGAIDEFIFNHEDGDACKDHGDDLLTASDLLAIPTTAACTVDTKRKREDLDADAGDDLPEHFKRSRSCSISSIDEDDDDKLLSSSSSTPGSALSYPLTPLSSPLLSSASRSPNHDIFSQTLSQPEGS
ncbi:hypothetical protein HK101_005526, partial [Irineochytrium annulatum]